VLTIVAVNCLASSRGIPTTEGLKDVAQFASQLKKFVFIYVSNCSEPLDNVLLTFLNTGQCHLVVVAEVV
jgi:hypothetical protein